MYYWPDVRIASAAEAEEYAASGGVIVSHDGGIPRCCAVRCSGMHVTSDPRRAAWLRAEYPPGSGDVGSARSPEAIASDDGEAA